MTASECDVTDASHLGAVCTQPGYKLNPYQANTTYELSFQQSCDCMSYTKVLTVTPDFRSYNAHFCTQPCGDIDCPAGYQCVETIPASLGDGIMDNSYCIPDCIIDGCSGFRITGGETEEEQCVTSSDSAADWHCAFPSDIS